MFPALNPDTSASNESVEDEFYESNFWRKPTPTLEQTEEEGAPAGAATSSWRSK